MSGHSKWSTIKREKGAKDAKRGAEFTKLGNAIALAARGGADPDMKFALRLAIDKARAANMPTANIQRSIDRGSGKLGGQAIEEVMYEGYGPGGAAILIQCATDNKNRTYPEVRLAFSKNGGNMAEAGSVAFQFERKGLIRAGFLGDADEALLQAIDMGAEDAEVIEANQLGVTTDAKTLAAIRDELQANGFSIDAAELQLVPTNIVEVTDSETARKLTNLINALEDLDDVTNVYANFEIKE
jgi:YebC/PmpR family DNA-binding regulatory protein